MIILHHHLPLNKTIADRVKVGALALLGKIQNSILILITSILINNSLYLLIGKSRLKGLCQISKTTKSLFSKHSLILILLKHFKSLTMSSVHSLFKWLKKYLEMFFNKCLNKYRIMEWLTIIISYNCIELIVCQKKEIHINLKIQQFYHKRLSKEMGKQYSLENIL